MRKNQSKQKSSLIKTKKDDENYADFLEQYFYDDSGSFKKNNT